MTEINYPAAAKFTNTILLYGYKFDEENDVEEASDNSFFKAHIWSRLTLPIQGVVIMIFEIGRQAIRGVVLIVSGTLTFDARRLELGAKDLVAIPIQVLYMPLISVIAFFSPATAADLHIEKGDDYFASLEYQNFNDASVSDAICTFVTRIFTPPAALLLTVEDLVVGTLAYDADRYQFTGRGNLFFTYREYDREKWVGESTSGYQLPDDGEMGPQVLTQEV